MENENEKITQEEFNEMVNDNMRDYQLTREESSKEVVEHLQSEGEDLSVIFIANNEEDYAKGLKLSEAFFTIKKAAEGNETLINAMFAMQTVRTTCQSSSLGDMSKTWFGSRNGVETLSILLKPSDEEDEEESDDEDDKTTEYTSTLRTIVSVCENHSRNLSSLPPEVFENLVACLEENVFEGEVVKRVMEVIKVCCGKNNPENKAAFFNHDGLAGIETSLKAHSNSAAVQSLICEAIQTLIDGISDETKSSIVQGMVSVLVGLVKKTIESDSSLTASAVTCLKMLGCSDELLSETCSTKELDLASLQEKLSSISL